MLITQEILETLLQQHKTIADIQWIELVIGTHRKVATTPLAILALLNSYITANTIADKPVKGTIALHDNSWFTREETLEESYWVYHKCPEVPICITDILCDDTINLGEEHEEV